MSYHLALSVLAVILRFSTLSAVHRKPHIRHFILDVLGAPKQQFKSLLGHLNNASEGKLGKYDAIIIHS